MNAKINYLQEKQSPNQVVKNNQALNRLNKTNSFTGGANYNRKYKRRHNNLQTKKL